ncbi:hypothetical protein [Alkalicoccus luteus]|uniref:hypothetical protein n=1 Tax=Alkalicoccus luteus TaxID=1237094 RepID=UPI0040333B4F
MARLHSDTGFSQGAFKSQSGSARAWMPFAELNDTKSSDCAASTGTPDISGKRVCLLENNVTTGRRDRFFYLLYGIVGRIGIPIQHRNVV